MLNKTTALMRDVFPLKGTMPPLSFDRDGDLHMLGVNYRGSPIVLDERIKGEEGKEGEYNAYGDGEATGKYDTVLRAGDRAPDSPGLIVVKSGEKKTLLDIFHATHHTILIFGSHGQGLSSILDKFKFPKDIFLSVIIVPKGGDGASGSASGVDDRVLVVEDSEGYAYKYYMLPEQESGIVVVRPDGVIGAIVNDADGVERYLKLSTLR